MSNFEFTSSGDTAKQNEHVVVLRRGSLYKMAVKLAGKLIMILDQTMISISSR